MQKMINLFPKNFRLIFNPDRRGIERFMMYASKKIKSGSLILDAGAGPSPYKKFFKHCKYEATDFCNNFNNLDFVCSLDKIPRKKEIYDAIVCTQVLEHVEYPQKVVSELYRVLRKGGTLFMTVPQGWGIHQEPYNYYNFTKYGIMSLLKNAGFRHFTIRPNGGYFWNLSAIIKFNELLGRRNPLRIIEYPITNILLPLILFPLDVFDRKKKWTLGYLVEAVK
jgi:SAM-dependent methyltransferase